MHEAQVANVGGGHLTKSAMGPLVLPRCGIDATRGAPASILARTVSKILARSCSSSTATLFRMFASVMSKPGFDTYTLDVALSLDGESGSAHLSLVGESNATPLSLSGEHGVKILLLDGEIGAV